ncbi:hypothetical protein [Aquimarina rhabdastrellae]
MKNILFSLGIFMLSFTSIAQSLSEKQMQNARATGYAIVAAKNPNVNFSIYMIKWDGVNSLEENAQTQINVNWHAQAVIKGNYFSQAFDGADFTKYSSVLVSQESFDLHKNTGTEWWIVCSTLPPFSEDAYFKNNVGIGTKSLNHKLAISDNDPEVLIQDNESTTHSASIKLATSSGNWKLSNQGDFHLETDKKLLTVNRTGFVGIGTENPITRLHIYGKNPTTNNEYNTFFDSNSLNFSTPSNGDSFINKKDHGAIRFRFGPDYTTRVTINNIGIGIGVNNTQGYKLAVAGKAVVEEIKVALQSNWPDYVFNKDYKLSTLKEVENHIKLNGHLKGIPKAKEVEKNGIYLGQMDAKLLQKIEELTLYTIQQQKEIDKIKTENLQLKSLVERLSKLEKILETK